ncbi:MAG TPA: acyl-CoA dehydrogenase [Aeromicrobium sp.]|nr:acyl-CoA dehydrogenase [Aeromicrobium sp.]
MSIAISDDHRELFTALKGWAQSIDGAALTSAAEADGAVPDAWSEVIEQGVTTIAVPESLGGGGGSIIDLAVALEASAYGLVPGPLLGTAVAATVISAAGESPALKAIVSGATAGVALEPLGVVDGRLVGDAVVPGTQLDWAVVGGRTEAGEETWFVASADQVGLSTAAGLDLSRRASRVTVDLDVADLQRLPEVSADSLRRCAMALATAEASGIAAWCLATAVEYAKVREQFGQPIGRFQAIKHLCAEMLETVEAISAVAWDAANTAGSSGQGDLSADVAGAVALDGAVRVAQQCIQVLGGIGFTFEHSAHLYLRRAVALRSWLGAGDRHAARLARRLVAGERRELVIDLGGADAEIRPAIREQVAAIADLPDGERRSALVDTGLLTPHWPVPFGRSAGPVEQIVIDQELAAAGVERPDIVIAAWALPTILDHGSDAQRERFVGPSLRGDLTWCQLFSEPNAGSDLASLATKAERVPGGWSLTGQKVWTSHAGEADWGVCLARTNPDEKRHRGITYFLVDMKSAGIDIRPLREMTGDALFNEVFLDGVFVPDDCVVGEIDDGWRLARTTLANERVAMGSTRLSSSVERAIELVSDPADFVRVGRAAALSTACALLGARSALNSIAGQGPGASSSVAKLLGVRNRQEASELVVDLLGERALLDDEDVRADVHEMLLTRCLSIAGGTTQILRNVAAEMLLGLPR